MTKITLICDSFFSANMINNKYSLFGPQGPHFVNLILDYAV